MKIKRIILLSLIVFFSSSIFNAIDIVAKDTKVKIYDNEIKESNEYMILELNIPQVKIDNNLELENKINNLINNDITIWKNDLVDLSKKYKEDFEKANAPWRPFVLNIAYNDAYNANNILSLVVDFYQYTGGAHGLTTKISYNFSLEKGEIVKLKDIFKSNYDYKTLIDNFIRSEIQKCADQYFDGGEAFKGIKETTDFYFSEDGLVIYFQLYDIAPYSSGIREFTIPYKLIKDGLNYI